MRVVLVRGSFHACRLSVVCVASWMVGLARARARPTRQQGQPGSCPLDHAGSRCQSAPHTRQRIIVDDMDGYPRSGVKGPSNPHDAGHGPAAPFCLHIRVVGRDRSAAPFLLATLVLHAKRGKRRAVWVAWPFGSPSPWLAHRQVYPPTGQGVQRTSAPTESRSCRGARPNGGPGRAFAAQLPFHSNARPLLARPSR